MERLKISLFLHILQKYRFLPNYQKSAHVWRKIKKNQKFFSIKNHLKTIFKWFWGRKKFFFFMMLIFQVTRSEVFKDLCIFYMKKKQTKKSPFSNFGVSIVAWSSQHCFAKELRLFAKNFFFSIFFFSSKKFFRGHEKWGL